MSTKQKGILSYDAFSKTVDEARIRTRSGALITLGCVFTLIYLILSEWFTFNTVVIRPELVVDRDRALKLDLNLDITFPNMPCDVMSLDIMDVSGELQLDLVNVGFTKTRLDSQGNAISESVLTVGDDEVEKVAEVDAEYCGPCYGSKDQGQNEGKPRSEQVCCDDCEAVKKSYAAVGWAFFDGENVEQCEREGYVARVKNSIAAKEGCRVKGTAQLNRINGNLHFAPGASFTSPQRHVHDLSLYNKIEDQEVSFKHEINHFSFGPAVKQLEKSASNPLDGQIKTIGGKQHLYSYFLKIVPTRFEFLNGTVLETNQFSTTHHDRPLFGGRDEDHPNTLHARGGIPGLFFNFEMSAVKVINREQWSDTWGGFLLNVISAIGGIVTVGAVLDKGVYAANKAIKGKKEK
ncbi:hypothetical protein WICPIJ_003298 [Wickerhamomyces pijperi]|uniref:Endoplasmic reticulum-Golgi intermediate compartment protein n=1 Tax=Wickerhamomyces pijperi TaxID=599730 RepID=A0A9P8TP04_WICPI|nr:hypothetical protein WICPIJ_003298 [Wickerhamomyces pijperi]